MGSVHKGGGVYDEIYNYPSEEWDKVLDLDELRVGEEEEEKEPEIEYVEADDDLEEEDAIENFGNVKIDDSFDNNDDAPKDDEEADLVDRKKARSQSGSTHRKLKDEPRKSKKR